MVNQHKNRTLKKQEVVSLTSSFKFANRKRGVIREEEKSTVLFISYVSVEVEVVKKIQSQLTTRNKNPTKRRTRARSQGPRANGY